MECKHCKKSFEKRSVNQVYCCPKCANSFNQKRFHSKNKSACPKCGGNMRKYNNGVCRKCRDIIRSSSAISGKTTVSELKKRYNGHSWFGAPIRKNARLVASAYKSCLVCGYDNHIEICHIKSIDSFPDTATIQEINNINNLLPLCPNHHWELDNGRLSISDKELESLTITIGA